MKKLLYFFIASTILFSCESNDNDLSDSDPIVGQWQLTSDLENGKEWATICSKKSTLEFTSTGNLVDIYFYEDGNNNCISETENGTWKNTGSSNYSVTYDSDTYSSKVNFTESNTVMSITETEGNNIYITIYKKI